MRLAAAHSLNHPFERNFKSFVGMMFVTGSSIEEYLRAQLGYHINPPFLPSLRHSNMTVSFQYDMQRIKASFVCTKDKDECSN
jgi:hypothetical protein